MRVQCLAGCGSSGGLCPQLAPQPSVLLLSVAAKQLHPQGDVVVPLPGMYSHVAGKEGRLQGIHHRASVVLVSLENLKRREKIMGVLSSAGTESLWT